MKSQTSLLVSLAWASSTAFACIGHGTPGFVKRNTEYENRLGHVRRSLINPRGNTEASDAQASTSQEAALCNASPPNSINALLPSYPGIGTIADILPNDSQALAIMQAINASGIIPNNVAIKGIAPASHQGNGIQNGYNYNIDTDCWWTSTGCDKPKHAGLLQDITTCDEPHTWGYTFDDGPSCTHNALYDFWAANDQKVSLMYIGSNIMSYPLQAQRAIMDGHHVCVHTWSHQYTTSLTTNQAFAELYYTVKAIKDILGVTVTCWRPPYGDVDDRIRGIAQGLGLRTYVWNGDTNDWNISPGGSAPTATIQANYNSLKSIGTSPAAETGGLIVLDHELTNADMQLAIQELPSIKQSWKYVVPLTACLNVTQPYAEDIIYPNFAQYIGGNTMPSGLPTIAPSITAAATVTPQGTLLGMANLMNTFQAGGPQTPIASYSLSYSTSTLMIGSVSTPSSGSSSSTISSSSTSTNSNNGVNNAKTGATSGAVSITFWKAPIALISASLASTFVIFFHF